MRTSIYPSAYFRQRTKPTGGAFAFARARCAAIVTGLLAFFLLVSQAHAYVIYTNHAAWEAALAPATIVTDTFSNDIDSAQSITLDSGIVSTNSSPPSLPNEYDNNEVTAGTYRNATQAGTGNTASNTITWMFPSLQSAFGADFMLTNPDRLTLIGDFDGTGDQTIVVNNTIGGGSGFLGIVGTAQFGSITFGNASTDVDSFMIDNASFARRGAVTVPEPGTLALLGLGLAGLAATRRRKQ